VKPIHIVPLISKEAGGAKGDPGLTLLEFVTAALARTFRTASQIRPEVVDISHAWEAGRQQHYSTAILRHLHRLSGPDARILGITGCDLYVPVLTFVFGEAQLEGPCAVISLARLKEESYGLPPRDALFRDRLLKVAVHELGHTFGLRHCADWRCVMASSYGVERLDVKGVEFCRRCATVVSSEPATLRRTG
jgi:archaemetzincin